MHHVRRVWISSLLILVTGIALQGQDQDGRFPQPEGAATSIGTFIVVPNTAHDGYHVATLELRHIHGLMDVMGGGRNISGCQRGDGVDSAIQIINTIDARFAISPSGVPLEQQLLISDTGAVTCSVYRAGGEYLFSDQSLTFVIDTARRRLGWLCFEHNAVSATRSANAEAELRETICDFKLMDIPYTRSDDGDILIELHGQDISRHLEMMRYDDRHGMYGWRNEYYAERLMRLSAQEPNALVRIRLRWR